MTSAKLARAFSDRIQGDRAVCRVRRTVCRKRSKQTGTERPKTQPHSLKGWQQIAAFLGQPVSVARRWAETGMPVTRHGRFVIASAGQLNDWLRRESGEPVHAVPFGPETRQLSASRSPRQELPH